MDRSELYLKAPEFIGPPEPRHACATRRFQGIPGVERAPNGRLWATWYGGGITENHENYVMLATCAGLGQPWTPPILVIDPDGEGPVRAYDPCLWHDPAGTLWLFWAHSFAEHRASPRWGVWAITTRDSGSAAPAWTPPVRLCDGIMMNKPTVLSTGEWLLPIGLWWREASANVLESRDAGRTFAWRGAASVLDPKDRTFDETMIVERRDGTLWMLVRTIYGIGETVSTDRGRTWSPVVPSALPHPSARFHIRRLRSGRLMLVKHGGLKEQTGRSHLTAFLSEDDGKSWIGGLLLDAREGVSYPDSVETEDGTQVVIYDFDRQGAKEINLAVFHERDILTGKAPAIVPVNRAHGAPVVA